MFQSVHVMANSAIMSMLPPAHLRAKETQEYTDTRVVMAHSELQSHPLRQGHVCSLCLRCPGTLIDPGML